MSLFPGRVITSVVALIDLTVPRVACFAADGAPSSRNDGAGAAAAETPAGMMLNAPLIAATASAIA